MGYIWARWLADALRAEGCTVKEHDGWQNRGRPASSGGFEPQGVTEHHTGTHTSYHNPCPTLNTCIQGRSDLPGPLAQVVIGYDGVCHVIAAGRANHAGTNDGFGPYYHGDGNAQSFGFEIDYDGTQDPSPEQKDAATRASVAVLRKKKHDQSWVVTHKETSTTGKWDTGQITGDQWRQRVKDRLVTKPGDDDEPYLSWPEKDRKALVGDVVDAVLTRDLYADDQNKDVSVGRALRSMENAAEVTL
jgi:N-acetylmuramoyl-L-alanine amidase